MLDKKMEGYIKDRRRLCRLQTQRRLHSRKMKADYEFVNVPIGIVLFVGVIIALVVFVQANMLNLSADLKVSDKQLQAVDAAHIIKDCFGKNLDGSMPASYLKSNEKENLCTLCKICSVEAGAKIELLEGPKTPYNFGFKSDAVQHKIFVTVNDGDKNYVSRLSVSISEKSQGISPQYFP